MALSTLSKGYQKPVAPSTGDEWMPAVADAIQKVNDHKHDGTLGTFNEAARQLVDSANWVASGTDGDYRQLMTIPSSREVDKTIIQFRTSAGIVVYPKVERNGTSTYYVYTNDNTASFYAYYG
jgi:hypothetical protein